MWTDAARGARVSSRIGLVCAFALLVLAALACEDESTIDRAACSFGDEHVVANARGGFDEVRVTAHGDGAAVVWSTSDGTYACDVDADGAPRRRVARLGRRCEGGLAAANVAGDEAGDVVVACMRLPDASQDKPGTVALFFLGDDGDVRARRSIEGVGRGSRGLDVLVLSPEHVVVAWSDGERHAVLRADVSADQVSPIVSVSRDETTAGPPALLSDRDRILVTWSETVVDPMSGSTIGEVLLDDGHGAPRRLASVLYEDARPTLTRDATSLVLGYRDEKPSGSRVALFAQRIDDRLGRLGDPSRIGRSDALSGASLFLCGDGMFAVAAHSYGRHEALVGISRLDAELARVGGERQIYTADSKYEHGVGLCRAGAALVLAAERAGSPNDNAALKAMTLRCR